MKNEVIILTNKSKLRLPDTDNSYRLNIASKSRIYKILKRYNKNSIRVFTNSKIVIRLCELYKIEYVEIKTSSQSKFMKLLCNNIPSTPPTYTPITIEEYLLSKC